MWYISKQKFIIEWDIKLLLGVKGPSYESQMSK